MSDYCPLRFVDSEFYLDESSCYLACTDKKINVRFQVATGSKVSSFCASALECLGISAGENVEILIDNELINVKVHQNNL